MKPPFRADHVGSLLRPEKLRRAREEFLGPQTPTSNIGPHHDARLREVEDRCVREVVAMQERVGLRSVTDGEFRRRSWWLELILGWEGFEADRTGSAKLKWRNEAGVTQGFSELNVTGKIRWKPSSVARAFQFLKRNTQATPKVTMPAPNCVHYYMGGRIPEEIYPDPEAFWDDLIAAYKTEIGALASEGAKYIQLDDTSIAFMCDPTHRDYVRSRGTDPEKLLELYAGMINRTLEDVPDDVTITLHQCRDTARAGGFEPLRLFPKGGKRLVLGLVSSKKPALETGELLRRRIDEASGFVALEQLALSPQCGFASSIRGNPLGEADQEAKLARIVEVAHQVWGTA